MRKALIAATALAASLVLPATASAGSGRYGCGGDSDDQVVGALIGGVLGGVIGHEVAGRGDHTEGTIAGAVVGGALGAVVADGGGCGRGRHYRTRYGYDGAYGYGNSYGRHRYRTRYGNGYYGTGYYGSGYYGTGDYAYGSGYGRHDPYQERRYRRHERREHRAYRRHERHEERNGFWDERHDGHVLAGGYDEARAFRAGECRSRKVATRRHGAQRVTLVRECRAANGQWIRR